MECTPNFQAELVNFQGELVKIQAELVKVTFLSMCWRWWHNVLETKCTKSAVKSLFSLLAFMTSQRKLIWLEYAQLYKNKQKQTKNSIFETTSRFGNTHNFSLFTLYLNYFNGNQNGVTLNNSQIWKPYFLVRNKCCIHVETGS